MIVGDSIRRARGTDSQFCSACPESYQGIPILVAEPTKGCRRILHSREQIVLSISEIRGSRVRKEGLPRIKEIHDEERSQSPVSVTRGSRVYGGKGTCGQRSYTVEKTSYRPFLESAVVVSKESRPMLHAQLTTKSPASLRAWRTCSPPVSSPSSAAFRVPSFRIS